MSSKGKALVALAVTLLALVIVLIVAVVLGLVYGSNTGSQEQPRVSFKRHVNPADPVILSVETPEGDVIYMLGNKSSNTGVPQSVDEFRVENDETTTFISMNEGGRIGSGYDSAGLQMDLVWDENQTSVYVSIVFNNGTEQLTINVNFSEPVGENITENEEQVFTKRSLHENGYPQEKTDSVNDLIKTKRQSSTQNYASVFVSTETCDEPESNANVFADVLLGYDEQDRSFEQSTQYGGLTTSTNGEYEVRIPTSSASDIGEQSGEFCDAVEMFLSQVCDYYSKANKVTKFFSGKNFDSVFCFLLGNGLRLAFPALRLLPVFRFCKNIFKPLKWYCNNVNEDIKNTDTSPAELICDSLPLIDNGVDFFNTKKVLFTPSAIFPQGNRVQGNSEVLSIPPGGSRVPNTFHIVNDQDQLKITHFSVTPFDPAPGEDYIVLVSYSCFSSTSLSVRMSIVGTDGYSDVVVCYFGPSCSLHVPGAEALVRDDVIVTIRSGSSSISRKVVIIF